MDTDNENMIAKRTDAGGVAIRDPFAPDVFHDNADAVVKSMFARRDARRADFIALGEIASAPLDAVKAVMKATEADDDALLEYEKALKDALLELAGMKSVIVQMKGARTRLDPLSVRGKFAEIIKACKARIDAAKPPKPKHTYALKLTCDDDALAAVLKAAAKYGAEDVCYAAAQSDKAARALYKWFEENMANG